MSSTSENRPDLNLALNVRSYERVVVLSNPESTYDYPEEWVRPLNVAGIGATDPETVVVVDRVELSAQTLLRIAEGRPRLVAFAPRDVEQEKSMRRLVTALFPWSEVWVLSTLFGKLLVTKDIGGKAYDRDAVVETWKAVSA